MEKSDMFDKALEMLSGDMDDMEGKSAMSHSADDCPNPLECVMHDGELGDNLSPEKSDPSITIEVHKMGIPSMDGKKESPAEDGLSPEEAEQLRSLLKK